MTESRYTLGTLCVSGRHEQCREKGCSCVCHCAHLLAEKIDIQWPVPEQFRYELVKNDFGTQIWDRQDKRLITIAFDQGLSVTTIFIDGVQYVVGEDGKSLTPLSTEGGHF